MRRIVTALRTALAAAALAALPAAAAPPPVDVAYDRAFPPQTVELAGARLHYRMGGGGPAVILLHGWPSTSDSWRKLAPLLGGRTVVMVDTGGLGLSGPAQSYEKAALARDVHALAERLKLGTVDLVGHDLGGQIAYAYAMQFPAQVRSLAILDIALPGLDGWETLRPWHFAFNQLPDLPEALTAGRERAYLAMFHRGPAFPPEEAERHLAAYSRPGAMHAGFEYYRAFPKDVAQNQAWRDEGRRLTMPVLWLGAGQGPMGPLLARQLAPVASRIEGSLVPGCGHWLPLECAPAVAERLTAFWAARRD